MIQDEDSITLPPATHGRIFRTFLHNILRGKENSLWRISKRESWAYTIEKARRENHLWMISKREPWA